MTVKNNDFPKYITLFCVYHKESALFQSDAVKPIRSGGARAKTSIGFLRDDTEDNISKKNAIYGELTANYWVWKNYLKRFPELQYIGFCHYRRFLGFKKPPGKGNAFGSMRFFAQFLLNFKKRYSQKNILKYISGYDVILPGLTHFSTSVYDQYLEYHRKEDLDNMIKTVKTHYPEYEKSLNAVLGGKSIYACLNYVMKKHLFEEWMAFVFGVTEKLEKISDWNMFLNQNEAKKHRYAAFLAERLFKVWLDFKMTSEKIKVLERKSYTLISPSIRGALNHFGGRFNKICKILKIS